MPVPLEEVIVDWQVIEGKTDKKSSTRLKILLAAVPNEIIDQYRKIAMDLKFDRSNVEAEIFGLIRSLVDKEEKRAIGIIDIGARSTTCSIIDKRTLKTSHSFDVSGDDLTSRIAKGLSVDHDTAEGLKRKYGISSSAQSEPQGKNVREILLTFIDLIARESDKIFKESHLETGKEVEKIIIAGGTALLPGLVEYLKDYFKKDLEIANPFRKIFYPPILEKKLQVMGPSYAIAVGMALRGLE